MKKIVTIITLVFMAVVAFPTRLEAATKDNVKQYGAYLAFGDSMSRGFGIGTSQDQDEQWDYTIRNIKGSYPYIVSKAIGTSDSDGLDKMFEASSNFYPCTYLGQTLSQTMDLFGFENNYDGINADLLNWMSSSYYQMVAQYGDADYSKNYDKAVSKGYFDEYPRAVDTDIKDLISRSDDLLISIELGMSDVFIVGLIDALVNVYSSGDSTNESSQISLKAIQQITSSIDKYYDYWKYTYDKFLSGLIGLNSNATICLISFFNPFTQVRLDDKSIIQIGDLFDPYIIRMNNDMKKFAKKYGCLYVDCYNADSVLSEKGFHITASDTEDNKAIENTLRNLNNNLHLSANGQEYIARAMLGVLPVKESEIENQEVIGDYDIRVDLSNYIPEYSEATNKTVVKDVSVKVDYVPTLNYTFNDTVLTVKYHNAKAKILTFDATYGDDNKKLSLTYYLKYENGKYSPYRVIQSLDVDKDNNIIKETIKASANSFEKMLNIKDDEHILEKIIDNEYESTKQKVENFVEVSSAINKINEVAIDTTKQVTNKVVNQIQKQTIEAIGDYSKEYKEASNKFKEDVTDILQETNPFERNKLIKDKTKENVQIMIEKTIYYTGKYTKEFFEGLAN